MNTKLEIKNCPICAKNEFAVFRFGLVRCSNCGLVLDLNIFEPDANLAINELYFADSHTDDSFWVELFERWNNVGVGSRILRLSLPGNRALEIGPGSGSFALWLRNHGFCVKICDLSSEVCKHLSKLGFDTYFGPISSLRGESFDLVIVKHVLEHVNNPWDFLLTVKNCLNSNGVVYIAVPNINSWEARLPGWNCYEPYHLSYFQPLVLRQIIEKLGLKVESIATRESFSGWYLAIVRTLLRSRRSPRIGTAIEAGTVKRPPHLEAVYRLTMIIAGIFSYPLRKIQGSLGYGDEIVVIARRSD